MNHPPDAGPPDFDGGSLPAKVAGRLVISGARILSMTRPEVLDGHSVLVEDSTIVDIVPGGTPIADAAHLDASGHYLLPALADMHVHFSEPGEAALFLANGVTTIRNMDGSSFHLGYQHRVDAGELVGPRVLTTSPILDGAASDGTTSWPGRIPVRTAAEGRAVVDAYVERGYRALKVYSLLAPDVLTEIGRRAGEHGVRVVGHCPLDLTQEQAVDAGMTCFEHLDGLVPDGVFDDRATRALARRYADEQIWNCPTMTQHQFLEQPPHPIANADWYTYAAPYARAFADFVFDTFASMGVLDGMRDSTVAGNRTYFEVLALLLEEGAPILAGTDCPLPTVTPGTSLHRELANLVRAGVSPVAALRIATVEAARFAGEAGKWGSVEKGASADLLLCAADPTADIGAVARPEVVLVAGRVLDRSFLDGLLARRAESIATPAAPADGRPVLIRRAGSCHEGHLTYAQESEPDGHTTFVERDETPYSSRTSRVRLDPDGCVVEADIRLSCVAGVERCRLEASRSGRYHFEVVDYDGKRREGSIELGPALLDPSVAAAAAAHSATRAAAKAEPQHTPLIRFDRCYNTAIVLGQPVAATAKITRRSLGDGAGETCEIDDGTRELVSWESWGLPSPSEFIEPLTVRLDDDASLAAAHGVGFFGLTSYERETVRPRRARCG